MHRREFTKKLGATVVSFGLLDTAWAAGAFSHKVAPLLRHWASELNTYCQHLRQATITPLEWQQKVENLYRTISLEELVQFIDFDRLQEGLTLPDLGVATKAVSLPQLSGLPAQTAFVKKIFGMQRDRAIIPHGHTHMASAHLVLKGQMHLRHYDRVAAEDQHWLVQPTVDKMVSPGDYSTISDEKDNVHWFLAESATAYTFDVIMLDLQGDRYGIQNLDMYAAESQGDGTLRVPTLSVEAALTKYGKDHH